MDIRVWNHAALCKLLWALNMSKNKLWIKWVHSYYIKGQNIYTMAIPKQASWVIQKIFSMRKYLICIGDWDEVTKARSFMIQRAYRKIRGEIPNVPWRNITCFNPGSPKTLFITWLALHGKLRTKGLLLKWGVVDDRTCVLCKIH